MISEIEFDKTWSDYDPFSDHDHGNDMCAGCFTYTVTCHHCHMGLMHSNFISVDDEQMIEFLCDQCGKYFVDNYQQKRYVA
jgi:hypothetical protein